MVEFRTSSTFAYNISLNGQISLNCQITKFELSGTRNSGARCFSFHFSATIVLYMRIITCRHGNGDEKLAIVEDLVFTLVHEINASLNCAIFGKIAQIKWIRLKFRKVLVRTT